MRFWFYISKSFFLHYAWKIIRNFSVYGYLQLFMIICDYSWLFVVIYGYVNDYLWLFVIVVIIVIICNYL